MIEMSQQIYKYSAACSKGLIKKQRYMNQDSKKNIILYWEKYYKHISLQMNQIYYIQ